MTDEIAKGAYNLGKHGLSQIAASPWAKEKVRQLFGKYIDMALDDFSRKLGGEAGTHYRTWGVQWLAPRGGALDIQKQLAKLGELRMRTPTGKKYNYYGPGTLFYYT